jgi:hypothetical protein
MAILDNSQISINLVKYEDKVEYYASCSDPETEVSGITKRYADRTIICIALKQLIERVQGKCKDCAHRPYYTGTQTPECSKIAGQYYDEDNSCCFWKEKSHDKS